MTDRVHGFSSPQDFARVVASAGHEDGWVAAGQVYCGECNSNLKRGHAKGCGQRFPSYTVAPADRPSNPEPFDLLALAHRLSLEWKALTEASNATPDPLQGLLRCIARDVNAALMLAFTAAEVRRQLP